jgi:hypothetical protein
MPTSAPGSVSRVSSSCSERLYQKFRDQCLNERWFASRVEYNEVRGAPSIGPPDLATRRLDEEIQP